MNREGQYLIVNPKIDTNGKQNEINEELAGEEIFVDARNVLPHLPAFFNHRCAWPSRFVTLFIYKCIQ